VLFSYTLFLIVFSALFWGLFIVFCILLPILSTIFTPLFFSSRTSYRFFYRLFLRLWVFLSLRSPQVCGIKNIPKKGGLVIISNHPSAFDTLLLNAISPRYLNAFAFSTFILFKFPIVRFVSQKIGFFEVDAFHPMLAAKVMPKITELVKNGEALIFIGIGKILDLPHKPLRFPLGLYSVLKDTDPVILPVYIKDGYPIEFPIKKLRPAVVIGAPLKKEDILAGRESYITDVLRSMAF